MQATAFSTIWNHWTTARRFQKRGKCLLGCGNQEGDCIEHCCRCQVVRQCCLRVLSMNPDIHATLHAFVLATPHIKLRSTLAMQGLLIYATCTTTSSTRSRVGRSISTTAAFDALGQAVREGAWCHPFTLKVIRERWATITDEAAELPAPPLLPYNNKLRRYRELGHATRRVRSRIQGYQ